MSIATLPATSTVPVGPGLSIFEPAFLGADESGRRVDLSLMWRNLLIGGTPGSGKSVALSNLVAHAALSYDCGLVLIDGKQVELGLWADCADVFVGPDQGHAIRTLQRLQTLTDNRYTYLRAVDRRKITPADPFDPILIAIDEIAYFSATVGDKKSQDLFSALLRDLVARGRAIGLIVVAATQRPSSDIIPTSLRDLFAWRLAGYCSTESSSDIVLGRGWAQRGFNAEQLDPDNPGTGYLVAESGTARLVKSAYLSDEDIRHLASWAAYTRRPHLTLPA
ncbi:FtsK/SpoIIIE domain-containing protein [Hamadaea tsunoensis]|uniref:FtsK/SpoIIIE domain-containing protein n=1 Tax=Hamadaea tsunoensis TaxID=53368 RepID=UPI00054EABBC|nr:FtsK/SpoIIIE domain-containing protein [Hamadaea tsunoensis]